MKTIISTLLITLIWASSCVNCNDTKRNLSKDSLNKSKVIEVVTDTIANNSDSKYHNTKCDKVAPDADTVISTDVEMGNVTSYFYANKTIKDVYESLLSKKYPDVKYLHKNLPSSNLQYRDEDDDVSISYVFGDDMSLIITLGYAGGITTIGFSQNANGTTMIITTSAD